MLIIDFLQILCFSLSVAIIAVTYREILLREPILHWWLRFGERYEGSWFFPIIWGCHKCIAGQIALWGYIGIHCSSSYFNAFPPVTHYLIFHSHFTSAILYALLRLLFAVCGAVLFSDILKTKLTKWT